MYLSGWDRRTAEVVSLVVVDALDGDNVSSISAS